MWVSECALEEQLRVLKIMNLLDLHKQTYINGVPSQIRDERVYEENEIYYTDSDVFDTATDDDFKVLPIDTDKVDDVVLRKELKKKEKKEGTLYTSGNYRGLNREQYDMMQKKKEARLYLNACQDVPTDLYKELEEYAKKMRGLWGRN